MPPSCTVIDAAGLARPRPGAVERRATPGRPTAGVDIDQTLPALERAVLDTLRAHPQGLSEHALIERLREDGRGAPLRGSLQEPLSLFRTHFLLFHVLYRLRERCWASASAHLEVGPLHIALEAYRRGAPALVARDPLRDYYLDPANLERMRAADVEALLAGFWARLHRHEARAEALAVLGLEDPVDAAAIKRRYRRLAMRHHPDRGGDTRMLQRLNAAMQALLGGG